jgi:hypothetical protein
LKFLARNVYFYRRLRQLLDKFLVDLQSIVYVCK